jgi:DNA invertase Pin-like site-specific DNA recombinase
MATGANQMMSAKRGGKRIAYVRVSSVDQNTERQHEALRDQHIDKTFTDKASGKDVHRPALKSALDYLRDGDVLVVASMDRLARNMRDLQNLIADLNSRNIAVEFVKEHLTFTGEDSPMSKLMLSILGGVAEFERALIKERQREGIEAAKKAGGIYKGRKRALTAEQVSELRKRADVPGCNRVALAKEFGISRQTLYMAIDPKEHYVGRAKGA